MVELQAINQILQSKSLDIMKGITPDYFPQMGSEIEFILNHKKQYGVIPDRTTFSSAFPKIPMEKVTESPKALKDRLIENRIYHDIEPCMSVFSSKMQNDSIDATRYLMDKMKQITDKRQVKEIKGVDIASQTRERWENYESRRQNPEEIQLDLGIPELDAVGGGLVRGAMTLLFARTNKGKSWVAMYIAIQAWLKGKKVLFYAGEMSPLMMGFRFDTFLSNVSNSAMFFGKSKIREDYKKYVDSMEGKDGFVIVTPRDFNNRKPTVSQIRDVAVDMGADVIVLDQLSLMADQQGGRDRTERYGNITEDYKLLIEELNVYGLILAQAGREADRDKEATEGTPQIHHLEYSDYAGQASPNVIAMNVVGGILKLNLRKNRMGKNNVEALMKWNIDEGRIEPMLSREQLQCQSEEYGF